MLSTAESPPSPLTRTAIAALRRRIEPFERAQSLIRADFRPSAAVAPTTGASIGRRMVRLQGHAPGRRRAAPSLRRRDSSLHDAHGRAAAGAQKRRPGLHPGRAGLGSHFQHVLQQRNQALAVRMQEAKVAGSPETLGQHVLQEQRQEARPAYGAHRTLAGLASDATGIAGRSALKMLCSCWPILTMLCRITPHERGREITQ